MVSYYSQTVSLKGPCTSSYPLRERRTNYTIPACYHSYIWHWECPFAICKTLSPRRISASCQWKTPSRHISTICYCQEHAERYLNSNAHNRIGKPKAHWLPQVTKLAADGLTEPTNLQKLPKLHHYKHYQTRQLRDIAQDRSSGGKFWRQHILLLIIVCFLTLPSRPTVQCRLGKK